MYEENYTMTAEEANAFSETARKNRPNIPAKKLPAPAEIEEEEEEDFEPCEGDYSTEDHCKFYQYGKLVLDLDEDEDHKEKVKEHMEANKFWPNVWFISDHGNAHIMEL